MRLKYYFRNITINLKLKPTKINPKLNLESIINTFQNHEIFQRIKLENVHFKSTITHKIYETNSILHLK